MGIRQIIDAIFDYLQGIVVFMAMLVMVYLFIFSPQEINGASMEETFFNGELIVTNKLVFKLETPKRGDVVIFKSPKNKEVDYIKRVIGLPGESVKLEGGRIYINGIELPEPYLAEGISTNSESYLTEGDEIVVPEGQYFVMGDNRPHSSDSREFGPIPVEDFIGKGLFRYWPPQKFTILPKVDYGF